MHVAMKSSSSYGRAGRLRRFLLVAAVLLVLLVSFLFAAVWISPWPTSLITRAVFTRGARVAYHRLEKHLPPNIYDQRNQHYDDSDGDAYLDVYSPTPFDGTPHPAPTVVWIHGGAWLSGNKNDIANYARILAARGFTVVSVDYALSPASLYPTPVIEVNAALRYLVANAQRLHVDPSRLFLAGDSAGAQIAAQVANLIASPDYAAALRIRPSIHRTQLRGVLLYCGVYDLDLVRFEGISGFFMYEALRAYLGTRDFSSTPYFAEASVLRYLTPQFPPAFLTAGAADPFAPQSQALAQTLNQKGVPVDTLFYPDDHHPPLRHEYQFNLDIPEGQHALDRTAAFIDKH